MATLVFTSHLSGIAPAGDVIYSGTSVGAVLRAAFADYPRLGPYILDDQGRVRKHVIIFIDDAQAPRGAELLATVDDKQTIYVLQALSGG